MAFLLKNTKRPQGSSTPGAVIDQIIKTTQATNAGAGIALPASTTGQLFRVKGGRVLIRALVGQVTTIIQTQADNVKVSSKALDNAGAAIGTAVDIAANLDVTAMEVGGMYFVEGDGTAAVKSTAGGALIGANSGSWIAAQGEIYLTASATNTGAMKWDCFWQPLDPGAYVEPAALTAAGLLQAAI
jgi:hypothetical protein